MENILNERDAPQERFLGVETMTSDDLCAGDGVEHHRFQIL
jgi:hypothetical protein